MTPVLVVVYICTAPVPPACVADPDATMGLEICQEAAASCAFHSEWTYAPAGATDAAIRDRCLLTGKWLYAAERAKGWRRGGWTECHIRRDEP